MISNPYKRPLTASSRPYTEVMHEAELGPHELPAIALSPSDAPSHREADFPRPFSFTESDMGWRPDDDK